jgi:hypothetical protein
MYNMGDDTHVSDIFGVIHELTEFFRGQIIIDHVEIRKSFESLSLEGLEMDSNVQ